MKKVSRQQYNRERTLESRDGLRTPKQAPAKRSEWKQELRSALRGEKADNL